MLAEDHTRPASEDDRLREACRAYSRNPGPLAKASGVGHVAIEVFIAGGQLGVEARQALARAVAALDAGAPPPPRR
jgi:hypothetical protein